MEALVEEGGIVCAESVGDEDVPETEVRSLVLVRLS
jgi:hypothetical protein